MINQATKQLVKLEHTWCDTILQQREYNTSNSTKILTKSQINHLIKMINLCADVIKGKDREPMNDEDYFNVVRKFTRTIKSNPFKTNNAYLCYIDEDNHLSTCIRPLRVEDIPTIESNLAQSYSNTMGDDTTLDFLLGNLKATLYDIRKHHNEKKVQHITNLDSNILNFVVKHPHDSVLKSLSFGNTLKLLNYYNQHLIDNYEMNCDLILDKNKKLINENLDKGMI